MKILLFVLCLTIVSSFVLKNGDKQSINQSNASDLTIYLIPHTHDDVGWLKTPDNYFYGDDQNTQWAGVQYTLDNVITQLTVNEKLKFSVVEVAFVDMWWRRANQTMKNQMRDHVKSGRLQFLNAGWCMSDQATVYYQDVIDQMTIGLKWVKQKFGAVPTVAWQLDPFGHQASFATLGHQLGFNSIFFARIHHQDKTKRENNKAMQLLWRPPQASGNDDSILAHVNFFMYNPPAGFCFDQVCRDQPIKSDPTLQGYNVDVKAEAFAQYFRNMSKSYKSNNLLHTLGSDFQWSNARMWTMNMDRLITYIHNHPEIGLTVKYATPSEYIKAIYQQGITFPTKTDDFFPYADYNNSYWSGYFTSRVGIKGFVRDIGRWLQPLRTKIALLKLSDTSSFLNSHKDETEKFILQMQKQMGILQHHDAVSGTQKQKVANQYIRVANKARIALVDFYNNIIKQQTNDIIGQTPQQIFQTHWNQTQNEWGISKSLSANKNVLLHLYNPGPENNYQIKIKIDSKNLNIIDANNNTVKGDIICGNTKDSHDCELIFTIKLTQTSWGYVKLQPTSSAGSASIIQMSELTILAPSKQIKLSQTASVKIHRNDQKFQLILPSGTHAFSLSYNYYQSFQDVTQKSGAYIFRPSVATKTNSKKYSSLKNLHYSDGHQMLVISMLEDKTYTKLYFSKAPGYVDSFGVQIETFVDSINIADHQGKQIVLDISTGVANNKIFYTDSNGLDEQKRVLNTMPTWNITVDQPVAANYYPLNSHIKINDSSKVVSVLVDRARGGAVIKDGVIELMLHRRTIFDDVRGVGQPLNETEAGDKGLTQLVRNYLLFGNNNRQLQKRLDQPISITWSNSNSASFNKNQPKNVVLSVPKQSKLWLRYNLDNSYLLRIQFLDTFNSSSSLIQIPQGYEITELTLGANQLLSEWKQKQLKWKSSSQIQTETKQSHAKSFFKKLTSHSANQIELKPLQIRTFQLTK